MNTHVMPLPLATPGTTIRIEGFAPGFEAQKRLAGMGIATGVKARIMQHEGGNLVLALGNTRLALTHALAQKILVAPAEARTAVREMP
ncbi:MAG: ferrous iron transport protein A [Zoogloeaceae bacterium]|jgi:Fe2+ transport system protein FeoA|nr:ferrous iron transport protein A [Zoogloeaceae bacterium]